MLLELVLNMLAEATTTEISKQKKPETFEENRMVAIEGGEAAGEARLAVEKRTGNTCGNSRRRRNSRA